MTSCRASSADSLTSMSLSMSLLPLRRYEAGRPGGRPAVGPPARTHSLQCRCQCRFYGFGATRLAGQGAGACTRPRPQYPVSNTCDSEVAAALYHHLKYFGTDWHDSTQASRRAACLTLRLLNLISELPGPARPGTQRP